MRRRAIGYLVRALRWLQPKPDLRPVVGALAEALRETQAKTSDYRSEYLERCAELIEARQMAGAGPWLVHEARGALDGPHKLREANPLISQGAFGDIELALQNVDWQRQINLSWLEFSRWGIQQLILISRLYYIKNPICRRLVDVCAAYVFARGVEITTEDEAANEVLADFLERNQKVFGHTALTEQERRKDYDGNLFWTFFPDTQDTGKVSVRVIDATEVQDIVCNPNDSDEPWYYRRKWTARIFDQATGSTRIQPMEAWYPSIGFKPTERPESINGVPVMWESPVYHRKCGYVGKWMFGCPRIYPMLDWAKEAKRFLEACASVRQALSQIAYTLTTKGGQPALDGAKSQLETTIGPAAAIWDTNPPAVAGAVFGSGPGTKLEAFKTSGSGFSPEDVRQYKLMCCMVKGVPETFLADVSTGNLATATTLDRPTETIMMAAQEEWVEDLTVIAKYVLSISRGAASGKLREAHGGEVKILEMRRTLKEGVWKYAEALAKPTKGQKPSIKIQVNFPNIREGDVPAQVNAVTAAMTLGNKGGQVVGIDEKEGVRLLFRLLGVEEGDELVEQMYPSEGKDKYDPNRTVEDLPAPISGKPPFSPGGLPQAPGGNPDPVQNAPQGATREALARAAARLSRALKLYESSLQEDQGPEADAA